MRMLVAAALLAATFPAIAEEAPAAPAAPATTATDPLRQEGTSFVFTALGHEITIPMPDWLTGAERLSPDVGALIEKGGFANDKTAYVEFFPKGQSIDAWTTTYSARITLEPERTLENYRQATIYGYSQTCKPEFIGMFTFGEDTPEAFAPLAFLCGSYQTGLKGLDGKGEILVAVFRKTDAGIAVIYEEWRGPSFNPYDPAGWPIDRNALQARVDELVRVSRVAVAAD
jgi:hypothetical protein